MAKPPASPPSSDIDGVDEDRQRIDQPSNSDDRTGARLDREQRENDAKPKPSRS